MRNLCEATGLRVASNERGLGTCPLCQTSWHCLMHVNPHTNTGQLRGHRANARSQQATAEAVAAVVEQQQRQRQSPKEPTA